MPRLDLIPEDDFDLSAILGARDERLDDILEGKSELRGEWADVVH